MSQSADRIIRRIMDEAESAAQAFTAEASEKVEAITSAAQSRAEARTEQILEQGRKEAEEQKRRILGMAELDARREMLAGKQELIDEAFSLAVDKLAGLDAAAYFQLLREMIVAVAETGEEHLRLGAEDLERMPGDFLAEVNAELEKAGKKGGLSVPTEPRSDLKGGFVLQADRVEINCSFKALLAMLRDELKPEVARELFG